MTDEPSQPRESRRPRDARQARLKQALRDNLKRRKTQARGKSADAPADDATRPPDETSAG